PKSNAESQVLVRFVVSSAEQKRQLSAYAEVVREPCILALGLNGRPLVAHRAGYIQNKVQEIQAETASPADPGIGRNVFHDARPQRDVEPGAVENIYLGPERDKTRLVVFDRGKIVRQIDIRCQVPEIKWT